jgi:hypothetical protein
MTKFRFPQIGNVLLAVVALLLLANLIRLNSAQAAGEAPVANTSITKLTIITPIPSSPDPATGTWTVNLTNLGLENVVAVVPCNRVAANNTLMFTPGQQARVFSH